MSNVESFGQLVKAHRRELGLTQDELARRVGCAPVTLRKIEYDDLRPSVQIAERLAMALNLPPEERAAFVRLARTQRPADLITPTPAPKPEEIGAADLSGHAIRGYALAERIGAGGMGAVYRAVQPLVEREVAIKIILPQYANHPDFIRRFEAEAQLVARLEHPHIVPLYDYWREPSVAFLVMRLLRGGSVRGLLEKGPLPQDLVTRLLEQIGSALGAAHRAGVVHRDLKPANVMLDEDTNAYLADFGIAKNLRSASPNDQSQAELIAGSPAYISPEQIRSESVHPQTDIYCLGVMLYELLTGTIPFSGPTPIEIMHQHLSTPLPPLAANRAGLPKAWDDIIAHATAKDPLERYPDVEGMLLDVHRVTQRIEIGDQRLALNLQSPISLVEADNPYKGLRAFGEGDAQDFFGREALTTQLLMRLSEGGDLSRFLAVIGPSGSGKSSVVGAGLIPALRRGGLPGSDNWFIVEMLPGPHPLEELEAALLRVAVNPPENLLDQLREDKRGLLRAVRRCLPDDPNVELVLVIDQFEEVFTLVQDEAVRAHLLDSLMTAVLDERSRLHVIVTLRADFTDRPLSYVDFGELLRQRSEFVLPLTPDELEQAIVRPAERVGLQLVTGLVPAIMRDVGNQPGTLPLLEYALTELFEQRKGHTLTRSAYQAIGGVFGALGRRAEEVYLGLNEAERAMARQLFLRLVTLGEGTEDTRRRVLRTELEGLITDNGGRTTDNGRQTTDEQSTGSDQRSTVSGLRSVVGPTGMLRNGLWSVVESFGKYRLLTFDRDPLTRGPTVEVAHEALLREWPRLREWLNESRSDVRLQRQLGAAAHEWQNANRDVSFLLTGARLAQFEGWAVNSRVALTHDERAYLDASIAESERQQAEELKRQQHELELMRQSEAAQRSAANRLRYLVGALTIFLLAAFGLAAFAFNQQNRAQEQTRLATSRELAAAAVNNVSVDPERSVLLALQAVKTAYSPEAEDALHRTLPALQPYFTLSGHTNGLADIAYSPDGTRVATASRDGTAKVWDAATGRMLLTLGEAQAGNAGVAGTGGHGDHGGDSAANEGHDVFSVAFSPDGSRLATGGRDGVVRFWDAATGKGLFTLGEVGQTYSTSGTQAITITDVSAIAFSPDGTRLATASHDGTVQVWDLKTKQASLAHVSLLGADISYDQIPHALTFSPDGTRLATAGPHNTAKLWDATTGRELLTLSGHAGPILDLAFSPDGKRLATASWDSTAKVWDVASSATGVSNEALVILTGHTGAIQGLSFSPDGQYLATASVDGTAKVWNAAIGWELYTLAGHKGPVEAVAFSPDGKHLATASDDTTARIWEASPGREWFTVFGNMGLLNNAIFSPDGTRVATSGTTAVAGVWDAATGRELITLTGHTADGMEGLAYSPDGRLIATGSADGTAKIWDAATGRVLHTLNGHTAGLGNVAFTPDGKRLATSGYDKTVRLWDVATGQELFTLVGHQGPVHCVAISPDGTRLISGGDESVAIVWDLASRQEVFRLPVKTNVLLQVAYSPDGKRISMATNDTDARVYDAATGELLMTLSGHAGGVLATAWSRDSSRLATSSTDKTVKIWDTATGQPLFTLYDLNSVGTYLDFNPDGTRLVLGAADGTLHMYVLPLQDLVSLAQARVTRSLTTEECKQYLHVDACPEAVKP